jgi:spore coat protein U-like protein
VRTPFPFPMMKQRFHRVVQPAAIVLAIAATAPWRPAAADAATTTADATINAAVIGTCNIVTVPDLAFGNFDGSTPLVSIREAVADLTVGCSSGTSYTVYLGSGLAPLGNGVRRMQNGTARLPYQIYQEAAHVTAWNETGGPNAVGGSGGRSDTGTGANQTIHVYGLIPAGTIIPGTTGAYADTLTLTVAY